MRVRNGSSGKTKPLSAKRSFIQYLGYMLADKSWWISVLYTDADRQQEVLEREHQKKAAEAARRRLRKEHRKAAVGCTGSSHLS